MGTYMVYNLAEFLISKGNADIVKKLSDEGANVNLQNNNGFSPLYNAAMQGISLKNASFSVFLNKLITNKIVLINNIGHEGVVEVLLNKSAEIDRPENTGRTPLHITVITSKYFLVTHLFN